MNEGKLDPAEFSFQEAVRWSPGHFWAHYYLAAVLLRSGKPEQVPSLLSTCLEQNVDFVWAYIYRGYAYGEIGQRLLNNGDPSSATKSFDQALLDFQAAERLLDTQIEGDPAIQVTTRYALLVNRAAVRMRQRSYDAASADLLEAIQVSPKQSAAHINLAEVYRRKGQLAEAAATLDQAIQLDPKAAELCRQRAQLAELQHDYDDALTHWRQAASLEMANRYVRGRDYLAIGKLLLRAGKAGQAADAFEDALRQVPKQGEKQSDRMLLASASRGRGDAYMLLAAKQHDNLAKAKPLYQQALEDYDHCTPLVSPAVLGADFYRARGKAQSTLGDFNAAAREYTQSLALKNDPDTFAQRGWLYLHSLEVPKLAKPDFDAALALMPEDPQGNARRTVADWLTGRGLSDVKLGHYQIAVRDADKALELAKGKETTRLYYFVARIYAQARGAVDDDVTLNGNQRRQLLDRYHDRAIKNLKAALATMPERSEQRRFWHDPIAHDTALKPLQKSTDWARMEADYGTAGQRR